MGRVGDREGWEGGWPGPVGLQALTGFWPYSKREKKLLGAFEQRTWCDLTSILTGPLRHGDYSGGQQSNQGSGDGA